MAERPKVKINIKAGTHHFTDEGGQLFGPGEWSVDPAVSIRLVEQGKAALVGGPGGKAPNTKPNTKTSEPPKEPVPKGGVTETPLPEGFPCQATLAEAGFTTVESLQVPDVKEKLATVEGLTAADVTKIGLAISKI